MSDLHAGGEYSPPDDAELLELFSTYQVGRAYSVNTVKRRRLSLGRFAVFMAPASITRATPADVDDWLAHLVSPRTKHAYRSDLGVFFRWAVRRGLLEHNPVEAVDSVRVPKGLPRPIPPLVLAEALRIASGGDQLALLLGSLAGLRVGEIAALNTADIDLDAVPPIIVVRKGKGAKDRIVPCHPFLQERLRGISGGWLFKSPLGPGPIKATSMSDRIGRVLTRAGGGEQRFTAHQLRHFYGTEAARSSAGNMVLVQRLMGHATIATTEGYVGWAPSEGYEVISRITPGPIDDELAARRRRAG